MSQLPRHNKPIISHQRLPCSEDAFLAVGGEKELGGAGVAAIEGPFCFAVADDEDSRGGHCCVFAGGVWGCWWWWSGEGKTKSRRNAQA